jgi:hypothetical protein
MDTDELIKHSRARFDHAAARRVIKEKFQAKLLFAHCGGMFRACPETITFLSLYPAEEIVILDEYETPVKVKADVLCEIMKTRWQEQMNAWLVEHEQTKQNR